MCSPGNSGGSVPYARTNIEVVRAIRTVLVIPNSSARAVDAGATIEDDTGLMNVNADMMAVAAHLRLKLQLNRVDSQVS